VEPSGGIDMNYTEEQKKILKSVDRLFNAKRYQDAVDMCDYGLDVEPSLTVLYRSKAKLYQMMGQHRKAEKYYGIAMKYFQDYEDYFGRAVCKAEQQRYDEATEDFKRASELAPDKVAVYIQHGAAHWEMGRWKEARALFEKAVEVAPDDANARWVLGLMKLQMNEFVDGWKLYDVRWDSPRFKSRPLATTKPKWGIGEGYQSVLVWGEQGVGDQVIYGSLLPTIRHHCPKVTAMVDPRLIPLFARSMPDIQFISNMDKVPANEHESHIPFASLGGCFIESQDDIREHAMRSYLEPDIKREREIEEKLGLTNDDFVVGLSWVSSAMKIGPHKSMKLKDLAPILAMPNCKFVNLQYGAVQQEIAESGYDILDSGIDLMKDLEGLAALSVLCDVIVSVSSSTVHIAGACGAHVKLLDSNKLWYWGNKDAQGYSDWYESVQIFNREHILADWAPHVERVVQTIEWERGHAR
jgi:tetratricopeptide (TPR) repeat protein